MDLGLSIWDTPKQLTYYHVTPSKHLLIPVGATPATIELLQSKYGISVTPKVMADMRRSYKNHPFFNTLKFTGSLRPYQQDVINACKGRSLGVVEAMTGSGKTITFINLICEIKEPTLILLNTKELVNQTRKSLLKFTNILEEDIGFIGSGKFGIKPITLALHQTMAKLPPEQFKLLNDSFGMVIADEVHIVAAETYYKTMCSLHTFHKFGFSATPYRDDGLTDVIKFATGPVIHKVPMKELDNVLIRPEYKCIFTDYYYPLFSSQEYQEMISDLAIDDARNALIYETYTNEYRDSCICMLCSRISQVNAIKHRIPDALVLTSKTKKKDREAAIEKMLSGEANVIISTYSLFSTGIDIPRLDTMFLCGPARSEVRLRQSAGRLMRTADGKTKATIVDFVDKTIDLLKYQWYSRRSILKKIMNGDE